MHTLRDLAKKLMVLSPLINNFELLFYFIVFLGGGLRLLQYLANRSLWLDEAFAALNVVGKSWSELLGARECCSTEPIGFLWIEKLAVQCLGNSEFVLRLFPLLAGIASLFLLHHVARSAVERGTSAFALALFAVSDPSIYYSAEVKPYSSDVAIALALSLVALRILDGSTLSTRRCIAIVCSDRSPYGFHILPPSFWQEQA